MSLASRSASSPYTSVQRLTVILCSVLSTMAVGALFYGQSQSDNLLRCVILGLLVLEMPIRTLRRGEQTFPSRGFCACVCVCFAC